MKIKLLTIALAFIGLNALGQITVTEADIIDVGDIFYQAHDTLPDASISAGNAGANQTWNFSSLQVHEYDTTEILNPSVTPFASSHPTANLCIEDDGGYVYIKKDTNGAFILGVDGIVLDPSLLHIPLPLNSTTTGSTIPITIDSTIFDPAVLSFIISDTLAPYISYPIVTDKIDSLRVIVTESSDYEVDAWGQLNIQLGTFDCLRLKTERDITSTFMAYCSNTASSSGAWYNLPSALIPPSTLVLFNFVLADLGFDPEAVVTYQWWTDNSNIKFALVEMDVDSLGNIKTVDFLHTSTSAAINDEYAQMVSVYPIPTSDKLIIESKSSNLTDVTLLDVMGKLVFSDKFKGTTQIDLTQISKGIYYLNLKTTEGELTKKIIIE